MITKYKIYENINNGLYQILNNILKDELDIKEIENHIGVDFEYKIDYPYRDKEFELQFNEDDFEEFIGMQEGTVHYVRQMASDYSGYEHWIEQEELNYVGNYLSGDTLKEIESLANITKIKIDINKQGEILRLLEELSLEDVIESMMIEIRMEHERAIESFACDVVNSFPFQFDYPYNSTGFNCELNFEVGAMMDHIEKNKLKVKNVKEFIEECDWDDFSFEIDSKSYENLGDFSDLNTEVYNAIQNYVISPDELIPKFIKGNNIKMFKIMIDEVDFEYLYRYSSKYERYDYTLFQIAVAENNDFLKMFTSEKFQRWYLKDLTIEEQTKRYQQLVDDGINDSKIDDDYGYLVAGEKYNL